MQYTKSTTPKLSGALFASGVLANSTPLVLSMEGAAIPSTVSLTSAAGGRKIEWSPDGGTTYYTATYDYSTAGQLVFIVNAPVTHIRLTGVANDTYGIA